MLYTCLKEVDDIRSLIHYSSKEVKEATNQLSADNLIGSGAFARVYTGTLRCTIVAIKVLKKVVTFAMLVTVM